MKNLLYFALVFLFNEAVSAQPIIETKKIKLPLQTSEKYQEQVEKIMKSNVKVIDKFTTKEEKEEIYAEIGKKINADNEHRVSFSCEKSYSTEKQSFTIYVSGDPINRYYAKGFDPESDLLYSFKLHRKSVKSEIYSAQNSYGAKVQVVKKIENEFALTVPKLKIEIPFNETQGSFNLIRIPYKDNHITINPEIKFEPKEARAEEKNVACAFSFKPISPYVLEYSRNFEPTITSPNELQRDIKGISATLINLYIYNSLSGEIYYESRLR